MLKNIFYTGVGAAALLKEKVEEEMKRLEEKGKIKTEDAKSFLESIEKKGKEEDARIKEEVKKMLKEAIDELGLATKEDIQKLKEGLQSKI
jgi:polyhydroxyalkanoate synthesis regulator phasin